MKKILSFLALAAALHAGCVGFVYHHFGEGTPKSTTVSAPLFEAHLAYLKESNFNVISADRAIGLLRSGEPLPKKCVVLTADDAYTSVYTVAAPILKKYNFPMTVFVTTEGVDRGFKAYMTWDQMRELQETGLFEFGNHSHTHGHFVLDESGFEADLQKAAGLMIKELGDDSKLYAYPYGEYTESMAEVLKAQGYAAFAQHSGPFGGFSSLQALTRFPLAAHFAEMSEFKTKANSRPMPVIRAEPADPIARDLKNPYRLSLTLERGDFNEEAIACFYGPNRLQTRWSYKDEMIAILETVTPVPPVAGRSRINCTAPALKGGGFYWYSHPVFNLSNPKALG